MFRGEVGEQICASDVMMWCQLNCSLACLLLLIIKGGPSASNPVPFINTLLLSHDSNIQSFNYDQLQNATLPVRSFKLHYIETGT